MKKLNRSGEKEMKVHQKTVRTARKDLKKEASHLKNDIGKKITFALTQDEKIMSRMKKADGKAKCKKKGKC